MAPEPLPFTPKEQRHIMKCDGDPVLEWSICRPAFPETGKTARLERYFSYMAQQWIIRWETILFPRACQTRSDALKSGAHFLPWRAELNYTVTLWQAPLLSLRLDAAESCQGPRAMRIRCGETWDCATGYPRTLRSFFPPKAHRWRKELLDDLKNQAVQRINSGESLLDPDCAQIMERTFDPDRFYLSEEGISVFYPLYVLGPYAEGIPVFTVPIPDQAKG